MTTTNDAPAPATRCTFCGDTRTITDRVDGEITCPECGYDAPAPAPSGSGVREALKQRAWSGVNPDGTALHPIVRQEIEALLASLASDASPRGEPVAWMDDGSTRAGSHDTAYRVVTAATKAGMPAAAAAAYTTPLYAHPAPATVESAARFKIGDRVTKTKGSSWTGRVVGTYRTDLTPEGYAVESETETGSVQIYPAAALAPATEGRKG